MNKRSLKKAEKLKRKLWCVSIVGYGKYKVSESYAYKSKAECQKEVDRLNAKSKEQFLKEIG